MTDEIPMLIKRCLTYGIRIYPYELAPTLKEYRDKQIPDNALADLPKKELTAYVNGLYLCSLESAKAWSEGHEILKTLGFESVERRSKCRAFVSLKYKTLS